MSDTSPPGSIARRSGAQSLSTNVRPYAAPPDLRLLLKAENLLIAPGCFDGLTARLAESLGFPCVYLGGWTLGAALACGEPRTNLTDLLLRAQEIRRAVQLPLVVDGNAGFGDAVHIDRTVVAAQAAGVGGIHIEDQVYPKRMHYHAGVEHIIPLDEMIAKIEVAIAARADGPMAIIGRTDAIRAENGSFNEAIDRGNAFLQHGVDAVMLFPETRQQAEQAVQRIRGPLIYVWPEDDADLPRFTVDELQRMGYAMVIYPILAIARAFGGIRTSLLHLQETGSPTESDRDADGLVAICSEIQSLIGFDKALEIEKLTTERDIGRIDRGTTPGAY